MCGFTILPSITTHARSVSSWRDKILEIQPLGLTAVGLFVTGVSPEQRVELYKQLETAHRDHRFTIPFVHAVADMDEDEYHYLVETFETELFNLHPTRQFPLSHNLSLEIRQRITIENAFIHEAITVDDLAGFQGVCLDVAHAEDLRRSFPEEFEKLASLLTVAPVRANHVSVVHPVAQLDSQGSMTFHSHVHAAGGEINYLQHYPLEFFGSIVAIELADSLADQHRLIPSIEGMLYSKLASVQRTAA